MVHDNSAHGILSIAQTALRINTDLNIYYPEAAEPISRFLRSAPYSSDIDISVSIQKTSRTDFNNMKILAEAESSWKLLADGKYKWFVSCFQHPDGSPAWSARMDPECKEVLIECGSLENSNDERIPSPLLYPLDQLLLIHLLAEHRGIIIHGAGVKKGDDVVVLAGVSGAGKTTVAELINRHNEYEILSDDRIIIREQDDTLTAYGSPWPGDGGFAMNEGGRLKKICFLRKDKNSKLRSLKVSDIFERLMPVSSIPWYDSSLMEKSLAFAETIANKTPGYEFLFRKDESTLKLIDELLET
jgi:hypothetical protein